MKKKISMNGLIKIVPLAILCIVTGMINPVFFAGSNLIDLARSVSFLLIVSVGVTYVLLGASLDMSIGSVMGLGGAICGLCLVNSLPVWFSILMGLLASAVVGIVNAVLIVNCRIPALIATLGTMYVARGIVNVLTKGEPYYPLPDEFKVLGQGTLAGIPYSVFIAVAIVLIAHFVIKKTSYGRSLMAVGGNREASRVSGINVKRVLFSAHVLVSLLAGFVGIIMAARLSSAQPNAGDDSCCRCYYRWNKYVWWLWISAWHDSWLRTDGNYFKCHGTAPCFCILAEDHHWDHYGSSSRHRYIPAKENCIEIAEGG